MPGQNIVWLCVCNRKAYSTQKVGVWKSSLCRMVYLYLIKLTQQKDAYLILTRKCFTIAIKTIQLSSHIAQHDEFIKATFSSKYFLKQTTYLLEDAKNPSYFITCVKTRNSIVSNYYTPTVSKTQLNKFPTSVRHQTLN